MMNIESDMARQLEGTKADFKDQCLQSPAWKNQSLAGVCMGFPALRVSKEPQDIWRP